MENRKKWKITAQQVDKAKLAIDELSKLRDEETSPMVAFQRWIAFARHWLMYTAAYGFYPYGQNPPDYYTRIMSGTFQSEIMEGGFHKGTLLVLKEVMKRYVYDSDGILTLELAAQTILTRLLSKFVPAVLYLDATDQDPAQHRPSAMDKKLIKLLSKNQLDCYYKDAEGKDEGYRLYLRLLLVTDYISGMTDSFAKSLYQELMGIY